MLMAVYGTLRQGWSNHQRLIGAEFMGTTKTKPEYLMMAEGIPFVIEGGTTAITVELYNVESEAMLKSIDSLEGHPFMYKRTPITLPDGRECEMYIYQEERIVASGDYADYKKEHQSWWNNYNKERK